MFAPESAATPNSIGVFSLSSGSPVTLRSKPVLGAGYEFYDVRVGTGVFCWVEINYSSFAWSLYAQAFADGQVSGDPQKDRSTAMAIGNLRCFRRMACA